jgi:hypothetical protein
MTTQQLILMAIVYAVALAAAIHFTRATARRVGGALAGGAIVGLMLMGVIVLFESLGWWRVPFGTSQYFPLVLYIGIAISLSPIYLVTWRVARRFGWRGLAICVGIASVIGPPRDYLIAAIYPEWMVFGPGVAPILADSATCAGMVALGHAVMRIVAGPAGGDPLVSRPSVTA